MLGTLTQQTVLTQETTFVQAPIQVPQLNHLHDRVREGLNQQKRRLDVASALEKQAVAKEAKLSQEGKQLRVKIVDFKTQLDEVDFTLNMLNSQRDELVSKNSDILHEEQSQSRQEEQERAQYVDSLNTQTRDAYTNLESLFEEVDDPRAPVALTSLLDCIQDIESLLVKNPDLVAALDAVKESDDGAKDVLEQCVFEDALSAYDRLQSCLAA